MQYLLEEGAGCDQHVLVQPSHPPWPGSHQNTPRLTSHTYRISSESMTTQRQILPVLQAVGGSQVRLELVQLETEPRGHGEVRGLETEEP